MFLNLEDEGARIERGNCDLSLHGFDESTLVLPPEWYLGQRALWVILSAGVRAWEPAMGLADPYQGGS